MKTAANTQGWIDAVPAEWLTPRLSFRYHQTLGKMLNPEAASGGEQFPYVANKDVQWDRVDVASLRSMEFTAQDRVRLKLEVGDLLVCEGGEVGRTAMWRGELEPCYFQKAIHRLRAIRAAHDNPRFLYYVMFAVAKGGYFADGGNKSTIAHLTGEALRAFRVPCPSFGTQTAIANFLDRKTAAIDELIEKKQKLLTLLAEKRAALINQAVTKGLDPTVPMKDSGISWIGEIPAHWVVRPLKHLVNPFRSIMYGIVLPGPHVEGGVPIVKANNCKPERLRPELMKRTTPEIESRYARSRLIPGDVVIAIRGSVGSSAVVPESLAGANLTQDAARISMSDHLSSQWTRALLQSAWFDGYATPRIAGATVKGINIWDLERMPVPDVPLAERRAIETFLNRQLSPARKVSRQELRSLELLSEYRQALITAAVTGQLDIDEVAE